MNNMNNIEITKENCINFSCFSESDSDKESDQSVYFFEKCCKKCLESNFSDESSWCSEDENCDFDKDKNYNALLIKKRYVDTFKEKSIHK